MNKQYFILSAVTCLLTVSGIRAQNSPIDNFLKKHPSREGVATVVMSKQMLRSIFAPPEQASTSISAVSNTVSTISVKASGPASATTETKTVKNGQPSAFVWTYPSHQKQGLNVPEAYSSVSISRPTEEDNWSASRFEEFKKTLQLSSYEPFIEVNRENERCLGYYMKKQNDSINEIVVLRQEKGLFSAIYIKGNIEVDQVDRYLFHIRSALRRIETEGKASTDLYELFDLAALNRFPNISGFKDLNLPAFDCDVFKQNMKDLQRINMEAIRQFSLDREELQRNMEDVAKTLKEQVETAIKKNREEAGQENDAENGRSEDGQ